MSDAVRYAVVIEQAGANFSACVPDLPGCISVGDTIPETERNIRDAITLHLKALREHGEDVPPPTAPRAVDFDAAYQVVTTHYSPLLSDRIIVSPIG